MVYLRNCWYVAGFPDDAESTPIARTFLDEDVVLYRGDDGRPVALANSCPHRFAPLDRGLVVGTAIQCPYHGLRFDRSGACVHAPSGEAPPPHAKVKSYPLAERYGLLWIWMGEAERAAIDLIPDFSYLQDDGYGWFNVTMYARGNYQLLIDNLLDLSHAEFLHPLLSSEGWTARNTAEISQSERTIKIRNVAENDNVIPIIAQMIPGIEPIGTTIQLERWEAPSLLHLSVEYYASNGQTIIPSGHFLTPETLDTTHYFVRGGQDVMPQDAGFTQNMCEGVRHIFSTQDIPLIEAQQRRLGPVDLMAASPAILKADAGAIRARRLLAKLIREERLGHVAQDTLEHQVTA